MRPDPERPGDWICITRCGWRRGHPDRHWSRVGGVVERWPNTGQTYVKDPAELGAPP